MTKKDTIIIAALINLSVLAILMLVATEKPTEITPPPLVQKEVKKEPIILTKKETKTHEINDLGDQLLKTLEVEKTPVVQKEVEEEWYTVKSGDNPWKIAKANAIKYDDILQLNRLDETKAKNLKPGDRIRIR